MSITPFLGARFSGLQLEAQGGSARFQTMLFSRHLLAAIRSPFRSWPRIDSSVTYPLYPTFFKALNTGRKSRWPLPGIFRLQSEIWTAASRLPARNMGSVSDSSSRLAWKISYTIPMLLWFANLESRRASFALWIMVLSKRFIGSIAIDTPLRSAKAPEVFNNSISHGHNF